VRTLKELLAVAVPCGWQMGHMTGAGAYDCDETPAAIAPQGHQHAGVLFCRKHATLLGRGDPAVLSGDHWTETGTP